MASYTFKSQDDLAAFNLFSEQNGGSVYQTSYWADVKNAWKPSFYMGYDENGPVLCALCLERDVKVGKVWYIPDGFVCDYTNAALISAFAAYLKKEMKKNGIIAAVLDPLITEKIDRTPCDTAALDVLLQCGFVQTADKNEYIVQPNVTIETSLAGETPDSLLKKCDKGVRHGLKAAADGALLCETYDHITIEEHPEKLDEFFSVMTETSDRVSFIQRDKAYYKNMVTALQGKAVMDLIYCDNAQRAEQCRQARETAERCSAALAAEGMSKKEIAALKKELETAQNFISRSEKADNELQALYGDAVPERICLGAAITSRFGKTAICLYGGTRNILRNTFRPTHFMNWHRLLVSMENGIENHDMGRITGDPYDENNPLAGLCKYKLSYGGNVKEFVGDLYLINDPIRFRLFTQLLPKVKKIKNTVLKKTIKSATVSNSTK